MAAIWFLGGNVSIAAINPVSTVRTLYSMLRRVLQDRGAARNGLGLICQTVD